jgi:hypothetical protein
LLQHRQRTIGRLSPRLFRERNILLVLFRHLFAIARRYGAAVDGPVDLLLPRHLRRLLFLRRLVVLGRRRRCGCRGCRCRSRGRGRRCRRRGCRCCGGGLRCRRGGGWRRFGGCRRWRRRGRRIRSGSGGVLGHQKACRHAHGHRCGRHNTRKFPHPNLHCRPASREAISVIRRPRTVQPRLNGLNRPDLNDGEGALRRRRLSKHLEIFALFPVRHLGLEALDLGVLDVDVVVDKARPEGVAEEGILVQRIHRFT